MSSNILTCSFFKMLIFENHRPKHNKQIELNLNRYIWKKIKNEFLKIGLTKDLMAGQHVSESIRLAGKRV